MPTPTKAFSGQGLVVKIGTGNASLVDKAADVFLDIAEVMDVDGPSPQLDLIEVTHLGSEIKERIAGLIDGGNVTLQGNFIPDDVGQLECREALTLRQLRNFRIVFPTTLTPNTIDFKGFVTGMPTKVGTNTKADLSINLTISSVYAWS